MYIYIYYIYLYSFCPGLAILDKSSRQCAPARQLNCFPTSVFCWYGAAQTIDLKCYCPIHVGIALSSDEVVTTKHIPGEWAMSCTEISVDAIKKWVFNLQSCGALQASN